MYIGCKDIILLFTWLFNKGKTLKLITSIWSDCGILGATSVILSYLKFFETIGCQLSALKTLTEQRPPLTP